MPTSHVLNIKEVGRKFDMYCCVIGALENTPLKSLLHFKFDPLDENGIIIGRMANGWPGVIGASYRWGDEHWKI